MLELDLSSFISPFVTAIITGVSVYVAMSNRISVLETKLDNLTTSVNKHNGVIERTFKLETEVTNVYHRLDDIKEEINHYHHN